MREHPILFSGPMVRAILAGRKTQTRRVVNMRGLPNYAQGRESTGVNPSLLYAPGWAARCPCGAAGDRLWVRETWARCRLHRDATDEYVSVADPDGDHIAYRADNDGDDIVGPWRPSIHMPRWASRLTLAVTSVRAERLQDISEDDVIAEGTRCWSCNGPVDGTSEDDCHCFHTRAEARPSFEVLWDQINGDRAPWAGNPWVWVVGFEVADVARDGGR